jgi:hypothetical protein
MKLKLSLDTPLRHIGGMNLQFHSFLTSVLNGGVVNITTRLLYPKGSTPLLTDRRLDWLQKEIWTFWRSENSFFPTGIQTPDSPAHSLDTNTDYAIPAFVENGTLI